MGDVNKKSDSKSTEHLMELSEEELKEISISAGELLTKPLKGWKRFARSILKPFHKEDPVEATYATFKGYFRLAGIKFDRQDAAIVRTNMLRLSKKLYEIHSRQTEEIDQELSRREDNG